MYVTPNIHYHSRQRPKETKSGGWANLGTTVPISTGIISFALVIAFSDYVRTVIWLIYKYLVTVTVIKSGLYDRVYLSLDWKSRDLVSKVEERVTKMKADVKAARQRRIKAQNRHSDAADEASQGSESTDGSGARLNSTAVVLSKPRTGRQHVSPAVGVVPRNEM